MRVCVFTATRAEYGLLYWLMKGLQESAEFELSVLTSGAHLSPEFGLTYRDIEQDGFSIDEKVEMLLSSDTPTGVAKTIGLGVIGFADALERIQPDCLVILGDRYEALAIAQTALVMKIPIVHLHGGEITEGAYDDAIRHAISKMSSLHFCSTNGHRQRLIQMGEMPKTVFNVGAMGLEHIVRSQLIAESELSESIGFDLSQPFCVATYHPVTLAEEPAVESFHAMMDAFLGASSLNMILTYPNADDGGRAIIPHIDSYASKYADRIKVVPSLGFRRYLSAVALCEFVIGNSSSGIIEVPSFRVPTINIGLRQKGRTSAESVIHCVADKPGVEAAIDTALDAEFREALSDVKNPYGNGDASQLILKTLQKFSFGKTKTFYDINIEGAVNG